MKKELTVLSMFLFLLFAPLSHGAFAAEEKKAEEKKVCMDKLTKDGKPVQGKDGKPVQECKTVKVHKKLDGTKVPPK